MTKLHRKSSCRWLVVFFSFSSRRHHHHQSSALGKYVRWWCRCQCTVLPDDGQHHPRKKFWLGSGTAGLMLGRFVGTISLQGTDGVWDVGIRDKTSHYHYPLTFTTCHAASSPEVRRNNLPSPSIGSIQRRGFRRSLSGGREGRSEEPSSSTTATVIQPSHEVCSGIWHCQSAKTNCHCRKMTEYKGARAGQIRCQGSQTPEPESSRQSIASLFILKTNVQKCKGKGQASFKRKCLSKCSWNYPPNQPAASKAKQKLIW